MSFLTASIPDSNYHLDEFDAGPKLPFYPKEKKVVILNYYSLHKCFTQNVYKLKHFL